MAKKYYGMKKSGYANMPQKPMMKKYPKPSYAMEDGRYIDTMDGIDMLASENARMLKKGMKGMK